MREALGPRNTLGGRSEAAGRGERDGASGAGPVRRRGRALPQVVGRGASRVAGGEGALISLPASAPGATIGPEAASSRPPSQSARAALSGVGGARRAGRTRRAGARGTGRGGRSLVAARGPVRRPPGRPHRPAAM